MRASDTRLRRAGYTAGAAWVALTLGGLALYLPGVERPVDLLDGNVANNAVLALALAMMAPVLTAARPRNPLGWLLHGLAAGNAVVVAAGGYADRALVQAPGSLPWGAEVALATALWPLAFVPMFTVLLEVYPSGRAGSRLSRHLVRLAAAGTVVLVVALMLSDESYDDSAPGRVNPVATRGMQPAVEAVALVALVVLVATALAIFVHTALRLRRAASPEREQLAWLTAAGLVLLVAAFIAPEPVTLLAVLLWPVGIVIGVLRYRLLDIQVVLRGTLVYGLLTAAILAAYAGVVAALTALVPRGVLPSVLAAAVVAVGVRPAYEVLHRGATRLVYGDRQDPVLAISRLGHQLAREHEQVGLLPHVARSVAQALRLPYVAIRAADGTVVAFGAAPDGAAPDGAAPDDGALCEVPLDHAGQRTGTLLVSRRTPGTPLSPADRSLLDLVAGPVGIALHAARLADELATSQRRLLEAAEVERARLRRDMHDGLGPSLSGVALGLEAAQLARDEPAVLDELLSHLRNEVQGAVTEVRRLVDGLRPAALEGGDLIVAISGYVHTLSAGNGVDVQLCAPAELPPLPSRVEVAAYRIVLEALTNVVRHSGARACTVVLHVGNTLELEVRDDGGGIPAQRSVGGVGLESMRIRADAVGGTLVVGPAEGGGTSVRASLPLVPT
jgi:signal transduction histidine kinase